ncbi:iron-containing alcohol dehydrogenase [Streptococcus pneumoniae]|nr:iron-containing alcohol dehydrogenase [Streptococcus pneumoniae]
MATFYVPAVNLIGKGVVNEVGPYIKELGYKKALLVTDKYECHRWGSCFARTWM